MHPETIACGSLLAALLALMKLLEFLVAKIFYNGTNGNGHGPERLAQLEAQMVGLTHWMERLEAKLERR